MPRCARLAVPASVLWWTGLCCNFEPCKGTGRDWTVRGQILNRADAQPVPEAGVEVFFWFAIDGPGNRGAQAVSTDPSGRFESAVRFTASCTRSWVGGPEAGNTARPPLGLDVTIRVGDLAARSEFRIPEEATLVNVEEISGYGVQGTIELPPILVDLAP